MEFNVVAELDREPDHELADAIVDRLADHHPAVSRSPFGRTQIVIRFEAEDAIAAVGAGLALIGATALSGELRGINVLPMEDFERLGATAPVPELLTVDEAAELLGVTPQAVWHRIASGSLPATRVGESWAILRAGLGGPAVERQLDNMRNEGGAAFDL